MDDFDEELLRAEAIKLCAPLEHEEQLDRSKRRRLGRDWPGSTANGSDEPALEYEKCLSQSFVRDAEDKDGTLLRDAVETALNELFVTQAPARTLDDILANIDQMSDLEVVKEISGVLKSLPYPAIRTLYQVLTGKRNNNGMWMQTALPQKLESVTDEETIGQLADIIRKLKEKPVCKVRGHVGTYNVVLPEGCTFLQAAETVLMNPGDLPQRCLRAMVDLVHSKGFEVKQLNASGSNREQLTKRLNKQAAICIEEARTTGYVAPLQKALRVVKFFTHIIGGDDGGLSELLDTPPAETDMLQRRLLFSMSQVDKLSMGDMEAVYHTLLKHANRKYGKRHPKLYAETIKVVFEEALYRCTSDTIPEYIVEALDIIAAGKPEAKFKTGTDERRKRAKCVVAEAETLFDLSSSLEHVLCEWIENPPFKIEQSEQPFAPEKEEKVDESSEDEEDYLMSYTFDKLDTEGKVKEGKPKQFDVDDKLESVEKDLTTVADEAATLAYVVVGRAMEERLRDNLEPEARRYLRSGAMAGDSEITDSTSSPVGTQEELLMRVLRSIPSLPPSFLEKVSFRLRELKEETT